MNKVAMQTSIPLKPPSGMALFALRKPLGDFGELWARSPHRPRPTEAALQAWDAFLDSWLASDLPLVLRNSRRRGDRDACSNGREVIHADNSPASWAFALALAGTVPDLSTWTSANIESYVPLSFVTRGPAMHGDLNRGGWKLCHIETVSDRKRRKVGVVPADVIEAAFLRFLSPRNMFLVPKSIAGAGELPEVVSAVRAFEHAQAIG